MPTRFMHAKLRFDQAEGLRRLLVRNHTRVVTLVAGKLGVGRTSMAINLAAAMAHSGKRVLVLDENQTPNNLMAYLGLHAHYDLLDAIQNKCKLREVLLNAKGFFVLPTARAMNALIQLNCSERRHLENALLEISSDVDVMLVDAAMPVLRQAELSSSLVNGSSLLVVVDATISGITDSYSLIKRLMYENASVQFEIVVNKVTNEQVAKTVFGNMAKVAQRNLATRLEYFGYIPFDHQLNCATQVSKPVIHTFSEATSTKAFLDLSQRFLKMPRQNLEVELGGRVKKLVSQVSQPLFQHVGSVQQAIS